MNILVLTRAPGSACEYYRGVGPFSKIKNVNLRLEPEVGWTVLSQVDFVLAERCHTQNDLDIIEMAKDFSVPVWMDIDDDFFNVPKYNPAAYTFGQKAVQERHAKCLAMADVVTVTCEHLKEQLSDFNKNIHVIPNAFNDYHWKWEFRPGTKPLLSWRGSATHRDDIRRYLGSMATVQEKKDFGWVFVGNDLWFVQERMSNRKTRFLDEMPTTHYWRAIKDFQTKFWHVPLLDNTFNRSKSNIGWIEATYAGAVCLCPDMPEWQAPGIAHYKAEPDGMTSDRSESYETALASMLDMSDADRLKAVQDSYEYIGEHLLLSKVNQKRIELMETICAS